MQKYSYDTIPVSKLDDLLRCACIFFAGVL
jgi:hypothetical protein